MNSTLQELRRDLCDCGPRLIRISDRMKATTDSSERTLLFHQKEALQHYMEYLNEHINYLTSEDQS